MDNKAPDYSFMKSGFDNLDNSTEETTKNVTALMVHFMENALQTASVYSNHAKRRNIVSEDIKRSLMLEVFFFQKRDNLEEKINKVKEELFVELYDSEDEEEEIVDENTTVNNDEFFISECECPLCQCVNNIYTRWSKWTPETPMHQILKNKLDNWDNLQ